MGKFSISVEEVIEAFYEFENNIAKVSDIKETIYKKRDYSFKGYASKYSFDQTIQAIINKYCSKSTEYKGKEYFKKLEIRI